MKNGKIRILETIRQGQIGGGESHVLDLVTNLNRNEFDPVVLSFTDGPMVERLRKMGITTHVVHTLRPFNLSTYNTVKRILISEEIDILHAHGTRALSNTLFPAKSLNLPVAYTVHGWSFHQDQPIHVRRMRELSEKFLTDKVDVTISVSRSNQRDGLERFNMKRSKVINYGIDLHRFDTRQTRPDLKAVLGIKPGKTVVGYLVRMTTQKDPFTLIRAVAEVKKYTSDIQFLFIGDGDLKEESMRMASELNLNDMITFHPFRTDVPDVLNAFDIYVLPSLWEGLPIGMLEAMAMEKAVVATPVDGSKEAVVDGVNGLLVPCRDHELLAKAILRLHHDKALRNSLGFNARKTVEHKFDLKMMVRNNEQLYRSMVPAMDLAA
jgi:glycosyltransferase involved in cell wall biosynthesis